MADRLVCGCGCIFDDALGPHGCPNCCGDSGPARVGAAMSETTPGETHVERRLREMADVAAEVRFIGWGPERRASADAGREALEIIRLYDDCAITPLQYEQRVAALLARCEGYR